MTIMRDTNSSGNLNYCIRSTSEKKFINSEVLCYQAIENADGVPFQLIFGQRTGEGRYLNVGAGIRQLLGILPEEFTEKSFYDMIDEIVPLSEDVPSEMEELREKFINGELKSYKAEILIRMPGGEKKWIQDSSLPLIDEETGKVIGAFGILFDINERKQFLYQKGKAKENEEDGDRLKSAFLRNISHEIRTPLNAIVGYSTLICDPENSPGKQKEFMDIIFSSTDHLLEIIDDIVEISKIEANTVEVKKEAININTILRKVFNRLNAKACERNISLNFVTPHSETEDDVLSDGYKLSQILLNLIGNAMKFTKEGKVEFGYSVKENKIEFYVYDTGIGVAPEHHAMIFDRFYQAEYSSTRRFEGTGLGLSISKAYVELLGGEIWFTSQPGKGSVFYFTIPNEKAEAEGNS
jgi:signal transduction histidine kinase